MRRVGLELEFSGVEAEEVALVIAGCLGGELRVRDRWEVEVVGTPVGDFLVELDSTPLKQRRYLGPLEAVGVTPGSAVAGLVEDSVMAVAREVVPVELVAPPIPLDRLVELDPLWPALRALGVEDTRTSVLRAYGFQLNAELHAVQPSEALCVLQAYLLLEDWLQAVSDIDLSRRVVPYINPFPEAFRRELLQVDPSIDWDELVSLYLHHNPTRNRPLDLLPLFAHVDQAFITDDLEGAELVKPRPAFHYRLPNCDIGTPGWTPAVDWNRWVQVERLATDPVALSQTTRAYLETADLPMRLQSRKWARDVEERLELPPTRAGDLSSR